LRFVGADIDGWIRALHGEMVDATELSDQRRRPGRPRKSAPLATREQQCPLQKEGAR
jgi:hypothetical protein